MRNVLFIFAGFDDGDVAWLASVGRVRALVPGEVLVEQGRPVADLFVVLQGEVAVEVAGIGVAARRGAGEIIGEMSFVDSAPPSATVRASEASVVFAVAKTVMTDRLAADVGFAARFYRALALYLADRLREATARDAARDDDADGDLDEMVLDGVSIAGLRFRRFIDTLSAARPGGGGRDAL